MIAAAALYAIMFYVIRQIEKKKLKVPAFAKKWMVKLPKLAYQKLK